MELYDVCERSEPGGLWGNPPGYAHFANYNHTKDYGGNLPYEGFKQSESGGRGWPPEHPIKVCTLLKKTVINSI